MNNFEMKYKLFCDYTREIHTMRGIKPLDDESMKFLYDSYITETKVEWVNVFSDTGDVIGFFIIDFYPNCHPDADFYIEEAYIVPEYRKCGYMSKAISQYVNTNPGTYFYFIVKI